MKTENYMRRLHARCTECGDCLLWNGCVSPEGFPKVGSKSLRKEVWERQKGTVPRGMYVVNACGANLCIAHLKLESHAKVFKKAVSRPDIHARRILATQRARQAQSVIMTMEKARELRASTGTQREIAEKFGVSQSLAHRIIKNTAWSEIGVNPFAGLIR